MFELRFVVGFLWSLIFESGFCLDGKQQNVSDFTNRRSVVFQSGGGTRKCSLKYGRNVRFTSGCVRFVTIS